jgi:hypothetical protein
MIRPAGCPSNTQLCVPLDKSFYIMNNHSVVVRYTIISLLLIIFSGQKSNTDNNIISII